MKLKVREICQRRALIFIRRSGLAVAVIAEDRDTPQALVASIRKPILRWRRKRGPKVSALSVSFIAPASFHPAVRGAILHLFREDPELGNILDHLSGMSIIITDELGTYTGSYRLDLLGMVAGQLKETWPEEEEAEARPAEKT